MLGGLQGNYSWGCHLAKAQTGCTGLAGSALQGRGITSEHWNSAALIHHNASTSLTIHGSMCLDMNKLKIHPIGMANLKKVCNFDLTLMQVLVVFSNIIIFSFFLLFLIFHSHLNPFFTRIKG